MCACGGVCAWDGVGWVGGCFVYMYVYVRCMCVSECVMMKIHMYIHTYVHEYMCLCIVYGTYVSLIVAYVVLNTCFF